MKKLALLLLLGLLFLPTAIAQCVGDDDQLIFRIAAPTNAHAELWNGAGVYPERICYEDVFGIPYPGPVYHPVCDATNAILWASDTTNAHVEMDFAGPPQNYSEPICFGDILRLECDYVLDPNPCSIFDPAAECIATISDFSNAHVGICGDPASFAQKVCCVSTFASSPMCSVTSVISPIVENASTTVTLSYDNFVPDALGSDIDCGDPGALPSVPVCVAGSCSFTCGPYAPGPATYTITADLGDLAGPDVLCGTVDVDVLGPIPGCSISSVTSPINDGEDSDIVVDYVNFFPLADGPEQDIVCSTVDALVLPTAVACAGGTCTFTCQNYNTPGPNPITVSLDDSGDGFVVCNPDSIDVVFVPNIPPTAFAGPDELTLTAVPVSLSGACDDTDGTINDCDWGPAPAGCVYDFPQVQAGLLTPNATSDVDVTCIGLVGDIFSFTLTATDNDFDTGSDDMTITIVPVPPNTPPTANAGLDRLIVSGSSVSLSGFCDDTDGTISSCDWGAAPPGCAFDFPQVQAGLLTPNATSNVDVTCVGAPADVFAFTLTATDNDLDTGTDGMIITIAAIAGQPFLQITEFDAEPLFFPAPTGVCPPSCFSDIIVRVLNSGSGAENVRIELQVLDPVSNAMILDPPPVGCGVVAPGTECTRIRDIAVDNFPGLDISTLAPGAYKLQASALDSIGAVHDREAIFFTVARPLPLPEFDFLLLPLMAFSVLAVLFLSKRKS